jgi:hypothetical protein
LEKNAFSAALGQFSALASRILQHEKPHEIRGRWPH